MNNKKSTLLFAARSTEISKLYQTEEKCGYVAIPASTRLADSFSILVKKYKLNGYKVLRKLMEVYLRIRSSANEDPHRGMRGIIRLWVARANKGNIKGFERCGVSA